MTLKQQESANPKPVVAIVVVTLVAEAVLLVACETAFPISARVSIPHIILRPAYQVPGGPGGATPRTSQCSQSQ